MAEANGKRVAIWGAGGVIFLLVVWIVIAAASIGSEASKLDSLLKQDQTSKVPQDQVKKQLTEMGFQISGAPGTNIVATGPPSPGCRVQHLAHG